MADEQTTILAACRDALRIPADCTDYDDEITDLIGTARADLRAGGVSDAKAEDDTDSAVRVAIKVYVKANFGMDNPDADRLMTSYETMKTRMCGDSGYRGES